ncbi:hypothetical protein [Nocardiopsis ansamitocini]|uniref:TraB n=1 Tax=Nocardiopsis ansamitocini TaxID=1670832 RepID=A0A9W6UL90_9ACTN|nr:hypothetical protein [Nocardiopsis ansamitocini]GLU49850.1 hypothetical protein Nans01_42010 [Nocardiopsis ansamitocini]
MAKKSSALVWTGTNPEPLAKRGPGAAAYLRPWGTTALMIPAGWAAHLMWGEAGWATAAATAGVSVAGGAITTLSYHLTKARTWYSCMIATASAGGGAAWMALATAAGTGRPVLDILVLGGATLSIGSNVHTWAANQTTGTDTAVKAPSWREITERIGALRGTRLETKTETEVRTEGVVHLVPGQTIDELTGQLSSLASAYQLPPGSIRAVPDPADSSKARVTIVKKDMLATTIPWPGMTPALTGASVADALLELGVYEDGERFAIDPRNQHCLTVGMSGAGKSRYAKLKALLMAARSDAFVIAIDVEKGRQTLGPLIPVVGWCAFSKREAAPIIDRLHKAVKVRADHLANLGLENWAKGCGLSFVYLLIEEASAILPDNDKFTDLIKVARSVGIHIEPSLQRATHTNLDTDARSNFGSSMCFGVRTTDDASYALPDYVLEAGAVPENWRKSKPGCCYAAIDGIDEDRHSVPIRIYDIDNAAIAEIVATLPEPELDPITADAFGEAYTQRIRHTAPGQTVAPLTPSATPSPAVADPREEDDFDMNDVRLDTTPDPDPDLNAGIDDELEAVPGENLLTFTKPKRSKEGAEEARARLVAQLQLWQDRGIHTFRAPDLRRALVDEQGLDRQRSWVITELKRLEGEGRITHHDGGEFEIQAAPTDPDREPALV